MKRNPFCENKADFSFISTLKFITSNKKYFSIELNLKNLDMNLFKRTTSWSNAEFIPLKLCVASFYVTVGAYFHNFFSDFYVTLFVVFGVTVVWTLYLWLAKMKAGSH